MFDFHIENDSSKRRKPQISNEFGGLKSLDATIYISTNDSTTFHRGSYVEICGSDHPNFKQASSKQIKWYIYIILYIYILLNTIYFFSGRLTITMEKWMFGLNVTLYSK